MLNDAKLRKLKTKDKPYKEHDNGGLYAYISTKGAILFRVDYSFQGKRKTIALWRVVA